MFPGAFKPVHCGHIALMQKYLTSTDYDVDLTILISNSPREGILPTSSKWFLEKVFARNHKVKVMIAPDASPIKTAYDLTGQAEYGPGFYALGASAKGTDVKRAEDFAEKFSEGGKYYEPETGVTGIYFPIDPAPINYVGRNDEYEDLPVSSTIVRNDIRNNDYDKFRTAYLPLLKTKMITEEILKQYFSMVSVEILPIAKKSLNSSLTESAKEVYINALNEGGVAGHMEHPYDVGNFTFATLKNLIIDLFAGKITDITEKLDGQNLFASVDEHGNTIFARNDTTLKEQPWYLDDLRNNPKWVGTPSVQHAFSNAGVTIDRVFHNIPNAVQFFNYDDKADGVRYRYWLNLEVIDTENFNVIPYSTSKVSFHKFVVSCFDYSEQDKFTVGDENSRVGTWDQFDMDEKQNKEKMAVLSKAIAKTDKLVSGAQITPTVIFKQKQSGEDKAQKYINTIDNILAKVSLPDTVTIDKYKETVLRNYLAKNNSWKWVDADVLEGLVTRWIYNPKQMPLVTLKKLPLSDGELMTKEQYNQLRDFDKADVSGVKDLMKSILKPLDTLFIKVGNEAIKCIEGLANAGHEKEVVSKLRKELADIKLAVENSDDAKNKLKLQQSLARLAEVDNELSSTEGIVFNYHGHTLKLTGSFAPLNQIFGVRFYNKK